MGSSHCPPTSGFHCECHQAPLGLHCVVSVRQNSLTSRDISTSRNMVRKCCGRPAFYETSWAGSTRYCVCPGAATEQGRWGLVVADPPWENASASRAAGYPLLPSRNLKAIPVSRLLAPVSLFNRPCLDPTSQLHVPEVHLNLMQASLRWPAV